MADSDAESEAGSIEPWSPSAEEEARRRCELLTLELEAAEVAGSLMSAESASTAHLVAASSSNRLFTVEASGQSAKGPHLRALVAVNDPHSRAGVEASLESLDHRHASFSITFLTTSAAAGGVSEELKALFALDQGGFDLVVIDLQLPSAAQLLPSVRERVGPRAAIVVLSSPSTDPDLLTWALVHGADHFLPKPLHLDAAGMLWQFCFRRNPAAFAGMVEALQTSPAPPQPPPAAVRRASPTPPAPRPTTLPTPMAGVAEGRPHCPPRDALSLLTLAREAAGPGTQQILRCPGDLQTARALGGGAVVYTGETSQAPCATPGTTPYDDEGQPAEDPTACRTQ